MGRLGCGSPLGRSVPTMRSHFTSCQSGASSSTVCTDYVEVFSMNVNLKMFCILCLCIILCDTSKASENLTFVLKQSLILSSVFVFIICHQANPWRGNLLLLNCAVSQPGDPRPGRTSHEIADSFNKQANKNEQIALNCSIFSK